MVHGLEEKPYGAGCKLACGPGMWGSINHVKCGMGEGISHPFDFAKVDGQNKGKKDIPSGGASGKQVTSFSKNQHAPNTLRKHPREKCIGVND